MIKGIRIKKGCRWFYGRYQVNGKSKEINLGVEIQGTRPRRITEQGDKAFEESKIEAAVALKEFLKKVETPQTEERLARAVYAAQTGGQAPEIYRPQDLYDLWLKKPRKRSPSKKRKGYCKGVFGRFCNFITRQHSLVRTVHQITPTMAHAFMEMEETRGVSSSTYNDVLFLMKCVFKEAGASAFGRLIHKEVCQIHRVPFSKSEILKIKEAAQSDDFIRPIIITAICTGMRLGDCCRLKWNDVDFEQGLIRVKTTKTNKIICVPIFDWLKDELQLHSQIIGCDYVFPLQERKYRSNPKHLRTCLRRILAKVGFSNEVRTSSVSMDEVDIPALKSSAQAYIDSVRNKDKAQKMGQLLNAYLSGKPISDSSKACGISKSTASMYLNEIEQQTGIAFIRGKRRKPNTDDCAVLQPVTIQREGMRKASIRDFHTFRTTWVTLALKNGVPMEAVILVTGHTTVKIVRENYFNPSHGDLKVLLKKALPFSDSKMEAA
jgi:integrase